MQRIAGACNESLLGVQLHSVAPLALADLADDPDVQAHTALAVLGVAVERLNDPPEAIELCLCAPLGLIRLVVGILYVQINARELIIFGGSVA